MPKNQNNPTSSALSGPANISITQKAHRVNKIFTAAEAHKERRLFSGRGWLNFYLSKGDFLENPFRKGRTVNFFLCTKEKRLQKRSVRASCSTAYCHDHLTRSDCSCQHCRTGGTPKVYFSPAKALAQGWCAYRALCSPMGDFVPPSAVKMFAFLIGG